MSSFHRKGAATGGLKDARSLFKQAKEAKAQKGKQPPAASAAVSGPLAGKTKAELLAILKAKQEAKKRQAEAESAPEEEVKEERESYINGGDDSDGEGERPTSTTKIQQPTTAAAPSVSPPPQASASKHVALESLVGQLGSEDEEEEDEEEGDDDEASYPPAAASDAAAAEEEKGGGKATAGASLPQNFFDDPAADARAQGIDPAEIEKKKLKQEWEEFQMFAAEVKEIEEVETAEAEEDEQDRIDRDELENMAYVGRLAGLMKMSDNIGTKRKLPEQAGAAATAAAAPAKGEPEDSAQAGAGPVVGGDDEDTEIAALQAVTAENAPIDSAVGEVSKLMRHRKKKKKKQANEDDLEGAYVPLDPMDWRSKSY